MDLTHTAFGTWSGGRHLNLGEALSEERFLKVIQHAYRGGIRTFMTADVYGSGAADEMLGRALAGLPRNSYCLVGAVGHDFYSGRLDGARGFPRFTNPVLRAPNQFADYLRMATEKSLERCRADKFDLLLLHNPDLTGFTSDEVWEGMDRLKDARLTDRIGIAPGPANGYTLDLLLCFERFSSLVDWAMVILNPLEPWPGRLMLPAAVKHEVNLITRAVDAGGLFHDDVLPGHEFGPSDSRLFRPPGWVEVGVEKMERMREVAAKHNVTLLQLACLWNLSQPAVKCVVPTMIQETGAGARPIEDKIDELAALPQLELSDDEIGLMGEIGENKGGMELKGASRAHTGEAQPDRWELLPDHELVARQWGVDPAKDLACMNKMAV